nr:MAG: putative coat protein [Barnaviridae sp.]
MSAIITTLPRRRRANRGGANTSVVVTRGVMTPAQNTNLTISTVNRRNAVNPQQVVVRPRRNRPRRRRANNNISFPVPQAISSLLVGGRPRYRATGSNLCVSNHEVLREVLGTTSFGVVYTMCIPAAFTWLRGIATSFSRYRWNKLSFRWVTSSPTSQAGTVAMGALYEWTDTNRVLSGMNQMLSLAHSFMTPVWGGPNGVIGSVTFDPTRWSKPWYCYNVPTEKEGFDEFVPAWLVLATQTQVNGQSIGHIICEYEIEFLDPVPSELQVPPAVFFQPGDVPSRKPFVDVQSGLQEAQIEMARTQSSIVDLLSKMLLKDIPDEEEEEETQDINSIPSNNRGEASRA